MDEDLSNTAFERYFLVVCLFCNVAGNVRPIMTQWTLETVKCVRRIPLENEATIIEHLCLVITKGAEPSCATRAHIPGAQRARRTTTSGD